MSSVICTYSTLLTFVMDIFNSREMNKKKLKLSEFCFRIYWFFSVQTLGPMLIDEFSNMPHAGFSQFKCGTNKQLFFMFKKKREKL